MIRRIIWIGGGIVVAGILVSLVFYVAVALIVGTGFLVWDHSQLRDDDVKKVQIPKLTGTSPGTPPKVDPAKQQGKKESEKKEPEKKEQPPPA
jgi:hypothetical protein